MCVHPTHLQATVAENVAATTLFARLLSEQPTNTVEVWPAWQDINAFEASIGWPGNKATADNSMLQFIKGRDRKMCWTCRGDAASMLFGWLPCFPIALMAHRVCHPVWLTVSPLVRAKCRCHGPPNF